MSTAGSQSPSQAAPGNGVAEILPPFPRFGRTLRSFEEWKIDMKSHMDARDETLWSVLTGVEIRPEDIEIDELSDMLSDMNGPPADLLGRLMIDPETSTSTASEPTSSSNVHEALRSSQKETQQAWDKANAECMDLLRLTTPERVKYLFVPNDTASQIFKGICALYFFRTVKEEAIYDKLSKMRYNRRLGPQDFVNSWSSTLEDFQRALPKHKECPSWFCYNLFKDAVASKMSPNWTRGCKFWAHKPYWLAMSNAYRLFIDLENKRADLKPKSSAGVSKKTTKKTSKKGRNKEYVPGARAAAEIAKYIALGNLIKKEDDDDMIE